MMYLTTKLREIKWDLRVYCGRFTCLTPLYFNVFEKKWFNNIYEPNPEIVIEGFGGSANSYAVYAFQAAQRKEVSIAHHLHVTSQIKWAAMHNNPVMLIIRNPLDAVSSLLSRGYYPSATKGLSHYYRFYHDVIPVLDKVVIASFEQLTSDFPSLIGKVNRKFGSNFDVSLTMEDKALECLRSKKESWIAAMPTTERAGNKEEARKQVEYLRDSTVWNKAFRVYEEIVRSDK